MEYKHLKEKHGFSINGWMVLDYQLTGNELLAFGLVFSLSQGRAGLYTGGIPFMAEFFGWSQNTCRKHLRALVAKGLIMERRGEENGVPFCHYQVTDSVMDNHPSKNEGYPSKIEGSTLQNLRGGTLQNLKVNNKDEVNNKHQFIPPTPQAVAEYVRGRGFADPEGFADYFIEICTNNGWRQGNGNGNPVTNWKNYIVSAWERNHKNKTYPRAAAPATVRQISMEEFENYLK